MGGTGSNPVPPNRGPAPLVGPCLIRSPSPTSKQIPVQIIIIKTLGKKTFHLKPRVNLYEWGGGSMMGTGAEGQEGAEGAQGGARGWGRRRNRCFT